MNKIRVTKSFNFETAHALYGYDGKCKNIHGHSYKLFVTVIGTPNSDSNSPKFGMVIDFGDIKKIVRSEVVDKFDHSILLNVNSPHKELGEGLIAEGHKVIFTDYQPSCENMLIDMVNLIRPKLNPEVALQSVRLHETETSYAEWQAEDNR
jgi:6-pyruvoyltetrahydropterin/6-carboxytetrahydropterin synthase